MRIFPAVLLSALSVCLLTVPAMAQALPAAQPEYPTNADNGSAGIVPSTRGFNLAVATTSQHDSSNGWSSLLSPQFGYRFTRHFSADVDAPFYTYINVLMTDGTKAKPTYTNMIRHAAFTDTSINGHFETGLKIVDYNLTVTLGLPSGDSKQGLGAGQVTYSLNNHFEKSLGIFTPEIELGNSDSSSLVNQRVRKSYVSVGQLAFFQAGTSVDLPMHASFSADAYEALPLTSETIFSTTGKGKKKVTTSTNAGVAEDNGFETSLDLPVVKHVVLSGFYNRSLRNHIDTAGFTLTFLLKSPKHES